MTVFYNLDTMERSNQSSYRILCTVRKHITAKHTLCPSYRRTHTLLRVKLINIVHGILSRPENAAGLFFEDYTTLVLSAQLSVRRIIQGHIQPT